MAPSLRIRHGIRSVPFAFLGLTLFDNLRIPGMVNTVDGTSGEGLKMYFIRIKSSVLHGLSSHVVQTSFPFNHEIELFIIVFLFCGWNYRQV